jgi:hypothetical protein
MSNRGWLPDDPIERFQLLRAGTAVPDELTPDKIQGVIGPNGDQLTDVAAHIAKNTALTPTQATALVEKAVKGVKGKANADPKTKAAAVSKAATNATSATADIELSDPVMLKPAGRVAFAGVLCLALAGCIVSLALLGDKASKQGSALVGLTVVGVLALVGILVLVMGYKNVTIKGGPPSS